MSDRTIQHDDLDAVTDLTDPTETARDRTLPNPTGGETVRAWLLLLVPTLAINLLLWGIASGAGASMSADIGTRAVEIGWVSISLVTAFALLSSTVVWAAVAHRSPGFANLWLWLGWGVGIVSLAGILGVSDVATGVTLTAMHAVTTIAAAHVLPRLLPRHPM